MNGRFGHYKTINPCCKDVVTSIFVILSFVINNLSDAQQHSFCVSLPTNKNLSQTSHRNRMITVCKQFENTDDMAPVSV